MYYEDYADIRNAIAREKQLKKWRRDWQIDLIKKDNPEMKRFGCRLVLKTSFTIKRSRVRPGMTLAIC
jgi:hypothetical protein